MAHHVAAALSVLVLVASTDICFGDAVRQTKERPLAGLINDLDSGNSSKRDRAAATLGAPFDGLPMEHWQFQILQSANVQGFVKQARPLLPRIIELTRHRDHKVAAAACSILIRMGTAAQPAVPQLARLANDEKRPLALRSKATVCALFVSPETTPVLSRLFPKNGSGAALFITEDSRKLPASKLNRVSLKMSAHLFAIWLIHSGHTQVEVPHMVKAATGKHATDDRAFAVAVLSILASESNVKLPGLDAALSDQDTDIRKVAAVALLLSRKTSQLTPKMRRRLKLSKPELHEIENTAREAMAESEKTFRQVVAFVKEVPGRALPMLIGSVRFSRGPTRRESLRVIAGAGPVAKPAIPFLKKLLKHSDPETRRLARIALREVESTRNKKSLD